MTIFLRLDRPRHRRTNSFAPPEVAMPAKALFDEAKLHKVMEVVAAMGVPEEAESGTHSFRWTRPAVERANAYLAIVAICHQTSPMGERQLRGEINGVEKSGWDYLKEKFLTAAQANADLVAPTTWENMTPTKLSDVYKDDKHGLTLNRIVERTLLLNDLGRWMQQRNAVWIQDEYDRCGGRFLGTDGLLAALRMASAYSDPVQKKSFFFASLAVKECGWTSPDFNSLPSPVDYHELRGHLRIGTVRILDPDLEKKVRSALPITSDEDVEIRNAVQQANDWIGQKTGFSSSRIHYLMWNVFRECCPRPSAETHCFKCPAECKLPPQYMHRPGYQGRCVFAPVCESAGSEHKVTEPPYTGHYY